MMHHFAGFMLAKALFLPFISAPAAQFPSAAAAPLASRADTTAALARIKSDIWYYPFPESRRNLGLALYCYIYSHSTNGRLYNPQNLCYNKPKVKPFLRVCICIIRRVKIQADREVL